MTQSEAKKIFEKYYKHLAAGYSKDSFFDVSPQRFNQLRETFKDVFDEEEYEKALVKGRFGWENIGRRQAEGSCLGNSRTWYYCMANKYGWSDKHEVTAEHKGTVSVNVVNYARPQKDDKPKG